MSSPTSSDAIVVRDLQQERIARAHAASASGGGGGVFTEMEARLAALEKAFEKVEGKLDKLVEDFGDSRLDTATRLTRIEERLDGKASAEMLAGISGRVNAMPTTWQLIALVFTILGGAFLIVKFGLPH